MEKRFKNPRIYELLEEAEAFHKLWKESQENDLEISRKALNNYVDVTVEILKLIKEEKQGQT
jgi:hypothetical protein